ncbi:AlpA family phage regulatory protein [Psychrobacter sp. SMN/5/1215-MNA-CIBAN-0208]|uniref:helix-turn-helix transcriptional regulator n=1 Tax=Psychrobacter sp. SMN/5/1215-MNA-CIBAN-0208 TaxID=3140442 RepID=UPI00332C342B
MKNTSPQSPVIASANNISNDIEKIPHNLYAKYLPPQGMSRASQLLPFLPFGSSTLWAWSKDGRFPKPTRLSPTMTAWRNADVIEWLNNQNTPISEGA